MTNYREILRLHSLGLSKTEIASSCQCARNTVAATLQRAANCGLQWPLPDGMSDKQLSERLFPSSTSKPVYKMPDYASVHKELQRSGVTLNLLWLEYCDQCRAAGEIPYQSTQFNKYYADYLAKVNATMHLNHKPGEVMQVDWAGDTAAVIDTDTGEIIPAYVFVATLPYSGYSYVEAFFSMNQDSWTTAHVNAYKYFGGVTRIIQCDNLKTGVQKHGKDEVVLNKSYQELAEHYGTAILPARVRASKDEAKVEQQGYKSCMGLLKLADKYTPERLENACKRALEYTPRPALKNIQAILASGQDKAIPEQSTATVSSSLYGFTRGADYYGRGNK